LYAQIGEIKVANDYQKKKIAMIPLKSRRDTVMDNQTEISKVKQCELRSIDRSGLYYKPKPESDKNREIMRKLDEQYFKTPFYGVLRLTAMLQKEGYNINSKRVRRLMKLVNWRTIYREPRTTKPDKSQYKYPYLQKGLEIERANQVWAMDIS
jgi:putative transposase